MREYRIFGSSSMVEQPAVNRLVVGSSPTCRGLNSGSPCFWVHILENAAGRLYVGSTDDVARRVDEHNEQRGAKTFTQKNGPWRLVWSEVHATRAAAVKRERQIKSMKSTRWIRENLLNERVPTSRD